MLGPSTQGGASNAPIVKGVDRWRDRVFAAARASLATASEQTVSTSIVGECDDKLII